MHGTHMEEMAGQPNSMHPCTNMHVCTYIYMHECMYIHNCLHIRAKLCVHVCVCAHIHVHVCVYACTRVRTIIWYRNIDISHCKYSRFIQVGKVFVTPKYYRYDCVDVNAHD